MNAVFCPEEDCIMGDWILYFKFTYCSCSRALLERLHRRRELRTLAFKKWVSAKTKRQAHLCPAFSFALPRYSRKASVTGQPQRLVGRFNIRVSDSSPSCLKSGELDFSGGEQLCMPFSHMLEEEHERWRGVRRSLTEEDREAFNRLFDRAKFHTHAAAYMSHPWPVETILLSIRLEHERCSPKSMPGSKTRREVPCRRSWFYLLTLSLTPIGENDYGKQGPKREDPF